MVTGDEQHTDQRTNNIDEIWRWQAIPTAARHVRPAMVLLLQPPKGGGPVSDAGLHNPLDRRARPAGTHRLYPHRPRHTTAHRRHAAGGSPSSLPAPVDRTLPVMRPRHARARASNRAADETRRLNLGDRR